MTSVTQRINQVKQPIGGYINPRLFVVTKLNDNITLNEQENVHSSLIGLTVDYLSKYISGVTAEESFRVSIRGAFAIKEKEYAQNLIEQINGLNDNSIIAATKLSGYDVICRAGIQGYRPVQDIIPDKNTIENIRIMVERSIDFYNKYGPVIDEGFIFIGGYTNVVSTGDGDFLTKDTLWEFKVSKNPPTKNHTLQLIMYYLMGYETCDGKFTDIEKIAIFNPRLNLVYSLPIKLIDVNILEQIRKEVIGYK